MSSKRKSTLSPDQFCKFLETAIMTKTSTDHHLAEAERYDMLAREADSIAMSGGCTALPSQEYRRRAVEQRRAAQEGEVR
jgi:hypothetical protein